jgi:hypothetical protein
MVFGRPKSVTPLQFGVTLLVGRGGGDFFQPLWTSCTPPSGPIGPKTIYSFKLRVIDYFQIKIGTLYCLWEKIVGRGGEILKLVGGEIFKKSPLVAQKCAEKRGCGRFSGLPDIMFNARSKKPGSTPLNFNPRA